MMNTRWGFLVAVVVGSGLHAQADKDPYQSAHNLYESGNHLGAVEKYNELLKKQGTTTGTDFDRAKTCQGEALLAHTGQSLTMRYEDQCKYWAKGFELWRHRLSLENVRVDEKEWDGKAKIKGKRVFVTCGRGESKERYGIGDFVHFLRCVKQLNYGKASSIVVEVPKFLHKVFAGAQWLEKSNTSLISEIDDEPEYDVRMRPLDLFHYCLVREYGIPNAPYLNPQKQRVDYWRNRLNDGRFHLFLFCLAGDKPAVGSGCKYQRNIKLEQLVRAYKGINGVVLHNIQNRQPAVSKSEYEDAKVCARVVTLSEDFSGTPSEEIAKRAELFETTDPHMVLPDNLMQFITEEPDFDKDGAFCDTAAVAQVLLEDKCGAADLSESAAAHVMGSVEADGITNSKTVGVRLPKFADWRNYMPFYKECITYYQQDTEGDWAPVVKARKADLQQLAFGYYARASTMQHVKKQILNKVTT